MLNKNFQVGDKILMSAAGKGKIETITFNKNTGQYVVEIKRTPVSRFVGYNKNNEIIIHDPTNSYSHIRDWTLIIEENFDLEDGQINTLIVSSIKEALLLIKEIGIPKQIMYFQKESNMFVSFYKAVQLLRLRKYLNKFKESTTTFTWY